MSTTPSWYLNSKNRKYRVDLEDGENGLHKIVLYDITGDIQDEITGEVIPELAIWEYDKLELMRGNTLNYVAASWEGDITDVGLPECLKNLQRKEKK